MPISRSWANLFKKIANRIRGAKPSNIDPPGTQRPARKERWHDTTVPSGRDYDNEIDDIPVRSPDYAIAVMDLCRNCPEAAAAIDTIVHATLTDPTGDEVGFTATADEGYSNIQAILDRVMNDAVGGLKSQQALFDLLEGGNAFATPLLEVAPNETGYRLRGLSFRPPWEMFRIEDKHGNLQGFEQRAYTHDTDAEFYHPLACIHWRFRQRKLYGRSLFHESIQDWADLKEVKTDLIRGARAVGLNPMVHTMPEGSGSFYREEYQKAHQASLRTGAVAHIYLDYGATVGRVNTSDPDLEALQSTMEILQRRIILKSHVPPYLMGMIQAGAQDLATQPAHQFARFISNLRMCFSQGIRQAIDLELALHGVPREQWKYQLQFPKTVINPYEPQSDLNNPQLLDTQPD